MPARVTERKARPAGPVIEYDCERLLVEPGRRALLRFVTEQERRIDGTEVVLPAGTVTVGHFWTDRAYTVYAFTRDRRTLAYYCSIVEDVRIMDDLVTYTDLVVDVLIEPGGGATVLDEDELPDDLDPRHRRTINRTLEELTGNTRRLTAEIERETRPYL